jgi:hypothetical protein
MPSITSAAVVSAFWRGLQFKGIYAGVRVVIAADTRDAFKCQRDKAVKPGAKQTRL